MNTRRLHSGILPLFFSIALCNGLIAQDINENNFAIYTRDHGLSRNNITGILQDSIGYLWVATSSGLNRFNGSGFEQFHSGGDTASLPAEYIKGMVWLDKSRLATFGDGLHIINTTTGETRNLFIPYKNKQFQYKYNWVMAIKSNAEGDIFIVARSGFYHFDRHYKLIFRFDYYTDEEVSTVPFVFGRFLLSLGSNKFAIVSTHGIYFYDAGLKKFKKMEQADCPLMAEFIDYPNKDYQFFQKNNGALFILKTDADSAVYIDMLRNTKTAAILPIHPLRSEFDYHSEGIPDGDSILFITGSKSGFYKVRFYSQSGDFSFLPKKYFPYYSCRHLLRDHDGNLWIATNEGLLRQDNNRMYIGQLKVPDSLSALYPTIAIDDIYAEGNRVYAASRGNAGLLIYENGQFIRNISFQKAWRTPDNIYTITGIAPNTLLVGTNGPLFLVNTQTGSIKEVPLEKWNRETQWIADLSRDRNGNVWIASENIYKYEAGNAKFSLVNPVGYNLDRIEQTQTIHEDSAGNMWMAGHGLLRYNTASHRFDQLVDSFPFIKIVDRQVNAFVADRNNNLWININNNGLVCYNISTKKFQHFTRESGLPDNNIANMIIIGNKLWMACFSGLACLDLVSNRITSFGKEDGFPDEPILMGTKFFYDASSRLLYIGFSGTIVRFDPEIIYKKSQAPHLFIESLVTGDQKKLVFPGKEFTTTWGNNEITFTIGSINFQTSGSQRFAYRLLKDQTSYWQQLGTQNTFSISNLSPGHHRIQVKLFSVSNRWPEQVREIDVNVLPPFWKETWFLLIAGIIGLVLLFLLSKWQSSVIRKKERAKTDIQRLKAEEYKSQFELEQISNYFSSSLADKKNVDDVLWDVSKNLIGRMNYDDCMIYLWNKDKTKMVQKASYGPKGNPKAIHSKVFDVLPGQGVVGHVMETKEPVIISDTRTDDRYRVDDISRLSEICVPIIHNSELIGIIDSEHPQPNHFKERDVKILTTIATLISNKIKQIESEQSLEIKQKEIALINQQLAEAQLSALQTQMNPHFIFNSLNSIKGMILENEQQRASRYMSKFANMIRITLNQSKEIFTTLYENMEHLENYLCMEKLRFDDSFTYRITADDFIDKEETLIPTLMIQPLVENAIWHGLMPKKGKKKLSIHFAKLDDTISCIIEDNGIGIKCSEELKKLARPLHQSVGLNNLRNRIKILNEKFNTNCSLQLIDFQDVNKSKFGSCAILRFNIILNKPNL